MSNVTDKRTIIYGPPGTGKTTRLIGLMEEYFNAGGLPSRICFSSFTKRSIQEAVVRASAKFGFTKNDLPYFRTIHSLSMGLSGIKNSDVMQFKDKQEFADLLGYEITTRRSVDGTSYGMLEGDKLFHLVDYSRAKMITLREAWEELGEEQSWEEVDRFDRAYQQFKQSRLLFDFTDMLERFLKDGYTPNFDVLFIDEAQDLSRLQWEIMFRVEKNAAKVFVAGDDDQGIYGWNGSDVDTFIGLEGRTEILKKSYRLTMRTYCISQEIIKKVTNRVDKIFEPSDKESGIANYIDSLDYLPLHSGEWLLLARNGYMLKQYEDHCLEQGYLFDSAGFGPTKWKEVKAIIDWERKRKGYELNEKAAENILQFTSLGLTQLANAVAPWYDIFDNISAEKIEYLRACKRNGEAFLKEPRIHINTIHGVKGGEAQNVCIMTDLANTTWQNYENNPDEEHRVFYVGVTRAIENLYIKTPKTNKFYDI